MRRVQGLLRLFALRGRALNQFDGQRESKRRVGASAPRSFFCTDVRVGNLSNSIMESAPGVVVRKNMSGTPDEQFHRVLYGFSRQAFLITLGIAFIVMW
jgi:hypothetical protein